MHRAMAVHVPLIAASDDLTSDAALQFLNKANQLINLPLCQQ